MNNHNYNGYEYLCYILLIKTISKYEFTFFIKLSCILDDFIDYHNYD